MRTTHLFIPFLCLLGLWNLTAHASGTWPVTFNDAHTDGYNWTTMQLNSVGNVCVCVTTGVDQKTFSSVMTSQYSPTGKLLWSKALSQTHVDVAVVFMKLDSMDNIYVLANKPFQPSHFLLAKYSSKGTLLWTTPYTNPSQVVFFPTNAGFDTANNLILIGSLVDSRRHFNLLIAKFSARGGAKPLWTTTYLGASDEEDVCEDTAYDKSGNLYVVDLGVNSAMKYAGSLLTFDTNGKLQTTRVLTRQGLLGGYFDSAGNIDTILSGTGSSGHPEATLSQYTMTGGQKWSKVLPQAFAGNPAPSYFFLDNSNAMVVVGQTANENGGSIALAKYDVSGNQLTTLTYATSQPILSATVGRDPNDNVFLEINEDANAQHDADTHIAKLRANLSLLWDTTYGAGQSPMPTWSDFGVDAAGRVWLIGSAGNKALAVFFDGATGALHGTKEYAPTAGWTYTYARGISDPQGDLYVLCNGYMYDSSGAETQASVVVDRIN